ncbi:unnamed protein product [Ambrosiozyma monospora]|uniref:Unnamed protein product n=1 Tax=Ambrosiozyma monospora TaxID=43982 RepID=A0ACB5UCW6_AMBMO|nr:unnamed protein product [Ambrosiozyma monospora]
MHTSSILAVFSLAISAIHAAPIPVPDDKVDPVIGGHGGIIIAEKRDDVDKPNPTWGAPHTYKRDNDDGPNPTWGGLHTYKRDEAKPDPPTWGAPHTYKRDDE